MLEQPRGLLQRGARWTRSRPRCSPVHPPANSSPRTPPRNPPVPCWSGFILHLDDHMGSFQKTQRQLNRALTDMEAQPGNITLKIGLSCDRAWHVTELGTILSGTILSDPAGSCLLLSRDCISNIRCWNTETATRRHKRAVREAQSPSREMGGNPALPVDFLRISPKSSLCYGISKSDFR